jgi:adenosylhomocysteine nucleosidase
MNRMLLRWLVNQYVRDAAEGKVRQVVGELTDRAVAPRNPQTPALPSPEPRTLRVPSPEYRPEPSSSAEPSSEEIVPCDVAFIYALGLESGGLVDQLKNSERSRHAHGVEHAGKLRGREVVIIEAGVGQTAAARATAEAIKFYQPKWVISAGFAGGLIDDLRRGHILMADEVVDRQGGRLESGMNIDRQSLAALKGVHVGRLLTVDAILREESERRRLAAQHDAVACDMETFAVAVTCRDHNVPFMAIRIISDAVDDELPPEIEHLLAQKSLAGKLGAATGAVLKRFSAAKDLWRLREEALKASDRLAKFLVSVLEQLDHS